MFQLCRLIAHTQGQLCCFLIWPVRTIWEIVEHLFVSFPESSYLSSHATPLVKHNVTTKVDTKDGMPGHLST